MKRSALVLLLSLTGISLRAGEPRAATGISLRAGEPRAADFAKLARAVPNDALALAYASGYRRLRSEVLAGPLGRSLSLPVFKPFRRRLLHGWQVLASQVETAAAVKIEEILAAHPGPVLLALMPGPDLRNEVLAVLVADVSGAPEQHRELTNRLILRVNQLIPGAEHETERLEHRGAQVTVLPAAEPGLRFCFAYKGDLFVASMGQTNLYRALDALAAREDALSLADDGDFQRALKASRAGSASLAAYVNLKRVIEHGERLDPDGEETRALRAFGLDAVTGVMIAEDISSKGVEDRLFVGIDEWRGVLAPLRTTGREPSELGRHFPAETALYLFAHLDYQGMLRAIADGLVRLGQPQQALPINAGLLTITALSAGVGGLPSGEAMLGVVRGSGWLITGAAGLGFSGNLRPLDLLRLLSAAVPPLTAFAGNEPLPIEGGRLTTGKRIGDAPFAPVLLEKSRMVFLSVDPLLLRKMASIKRGQSLAEAPFCKDLFDSVPGQALAAGYADLPYILEGLPGFAGALLTSIRKRVKEQTGFEVLLMPEPEVLFADWGPGAFVITRVDDGLHLKARSPFGLAMPLGGTAAASALERLRRRSPVEPGAAAGIVSDVAMPPNVDGNPNEPVYAQALECGLGERAGKAWMLTSGGRLYVAGKVNFTGGEANARTTFTIWTGHKAGETRFSIAFTPGKEPQTSYGGLAAMAWRPPIQFNHALETDKPGTGVFNFEAVLPLAGFMLDPATATCVWRLQVTVGPEGNETARWSGIDAPGYLILRVLKGGMPGRLTEEMILGRGRPTVPLPPAPLPPADVIF